MHHLTYILQELVYDQPSSIVLKALVCARMLDLRISLRRSAEAVASLRTAAGQVIEGHGIIKYLCMIDTGGPGFYPSPPYNSQSSLRAAQIDAWIDFGTSLLQGLTLLPKKSDEVRFQF